jgi:hypothetical protein
MPLPVKIGPFAMVDWYGTPVASGKADVLALPASLHLGQWLGLVMLGVIAWLLYRTAVK